MLEVLSRIIVIATLRIVTVSLLQSISTFGPNEVGLGERPASVRCLVRFKVAFHDLGDLAWVLQMIGCICVRFHA